MITVGLIVLGLLAAIIFATRRSSRPKTPSAVANQTHAADPVPIWLIAAATDSTRCSDPPCSDPTPNATSSDCDGGGTADGSSGGDGGGGGGSD